MVLLLGIEKLPEVLVGIIPACFDGFVYGCFKLIGIHWLQEIVETIELESLYRIFIVCGGEYDGDGCRGVFQSLETQAVGKADIRKDKVCRLA